MEFDENKTYETIIEVVTNLDTCVDRHSFITGKELNKLSPIFDIIFNDDNCGFFECSYYSSTNDYGKVYGKEFYNIDDETFELLLTIFPSVDYGFHIIEYIKICEIETVKEWE